MSTPSTGNHPPGAVRHAEKRRTATCKFADRIATVSIECFRCVVPEDFRENQKQTCMATIVAHSEDNGALQVLGMGVGTKFLSEEVITEEAKGDFGCDDEGVLGLDGVLYFGYGQRVRDCHAEVLARRAFRRQMLLEIRGQASDVSKGLKILEKTCHGWYRLKKGVTLHMYSSSAPCGNATLKKFASMTKEKFDATLGTDEWPSTPHEPIGAHSLRLGQYALLIKKDNKAPPNVEVPPPPTSSKPWPAKESDDWCPPGTSTVWFKKGSIHTCSDKICRWNYLGLQGSFLASQLESPLYIASLTVGRKFTSCICRRAVCCRAIPKSKKAGTANGKYMLHHPAIMGTGVYMDDSGKFNRVVRRGPRLSDVCASGTLDMGPESKFGQDVQFFNPSCWVWWPSLHAESNQDQAECINGNTGFATTDKDDEPRVSRVSTSSLQTLFQSCTENQNSDQANQGQFSLSLNTLKELKETVSPTYESEKHRLLSSHPLFRQWLPR